MAKKNRGPRPPVVNVTSSTTVAVSGGISSSEFKQLLDIQSAALGELTAVKTLLEMSKEVKKAETPVLETPTNSRNVSPEILALRALKDKHAKQVTPTAAAAAPDLDRIQEKMFEIAKEHLKVSRRTLKTQEEFQKEWDVEAKNIAEMAQGMKVFKTLGEKMADKREGLKEKYGVAGGGLKKTVLGALNVGGVFNKTLARDEFIKKQKALGSKATVADLKADFEGAQTATKAIKKNEGKIQALKDLTGASEDELKVHHPHLFDERQKQTEQLSKYDRQARMFSPDKKNAKLAGLLPTAGTSKTPTATAAEAMQGEELAEEGKRTQEEELKYLKIIAENTGGVHKNAGDKKPEPAKAEGGGFLDTIMSFLGTGLMNAFKALFNPMNILKALGKVFAIGMIVGALFEGVMDGFDEFMKTGDIGKALIAGLAGIIDFLTFGLFDKEKIKEVIGDFSKWIGDHVVKPFAEFITTMKDSFMALIENIGIPEIKFKIPVIGKEVSIGPFYPFKSDAKPSASPEAPAPTSSGNQVEQQSADNAGAILTPAASSSTNVVNAPQTTNNSTTQIIKSPIRNQESSQSRYLSSKYA